MPEAKVGRAFGLHRSLDQAGAIIGPLLAFALFPFVGFVGVFNFSFVLARASDLGVADNMVLLIYAVIKAAHNLIGYPAGMLAERVGKETPLSISYGVFLASTVLMLLSTSSTHAYLVAAVYGVYIGIAETVQKAVVPKYIAGHLRGTAYGLYNVGIGFSFLAANLVFGFLLDLSGISAAATYSIATSVIATAALVGFKALTRSRTA